MNGSTNQRIVQLFEVLFEKEDFGRVSIPRMYATHNLHIDETDDNWGHRNFDGKTWRDVNWLEITEEHLFYFNFIPEQEVIKLLPGVLMSSVKYCENRNFAIELLELLNIDTSRVPKPLQRALSVYRELQSLEELIESILDQYYETS